MHVLIVFAHPSPKSFCRAVLERFRQGLEAGGHTSEVVDLYAIDFDPVLRPRDWPNWIDETMPPDLPERTDLKQQIIDSAGGPIRRFLVGSRLKNATPLELIGLLKRHKPRDVAEQQEKVARADALAFICEKALIINTTLFNENAYATGLGEAMRRLIDEFALRYPGIKEVEHVYFYSVGSVDDATRRGYLERAFELGKHFAPQPRAEPSRHPVQHEQEQRP